MQDSAVPNLNTSNERSGSSEQGASERSEAAPERKLPRSELYNSAQQILQKLPISLGEVRVFAGELAAEIKILIMILSFGNDASRAASVRFKHNL